MDMSNFRPESHVAQQSRRDKLRIQQCSTSVQLLEDLTDQHSLEQSSVNVRNGNLLYDSSTFVSSEAIINSANSNVSTAQREAAQHKNNRPAMTGGDLFTILPHPAPAAASSHPFRATGDFQDSCDLKSLDIQTISEWMVNYPSGSSGRENNQNAMLDGQVLSNNNSKCRKYLRPNNNYSEYQDTNPPTEMPYQYKEKIFGDMHYATPIFQNTVQDVVTLSSVGTQGLEVASLMQQNSRENGHVTWTDHSGNELVFLPNYGNEVGAYRYNDPSTWTNRPAAESCYQWSTESGNVASDATTQGLSLSLSSNPPSKVNVGQFGERYESKDLHSKLDLRAVKSTFPKPSIISKGCRKSVHDVGASSCNVHRNTGPLGPFTGYAAILKNSRFLKPAQELLDDICSVNKSKQGKRSNESERFSGDRASAWTSAEANAVVAADREVGGKGTNDTSDFSPSTFNSSNQISCEGGVGSSSGGSYKPEYQEMRAKLLYLQEEVSKRYKLYHQQLQMVVSSFESVVGLSAATPYVSLDFKSISKNFRDLKTAIVYHLKHVAKALGEEMRSSATGTSSTKDSTNTSKLNCLEQILQKHKSGGANVGFLEPQQHVWRAQRGLPECAVAILRAWLFEHFLHPYPTDTDKHMLATQTGLSRNQVSNWFINARVRVWKPMVEEIHMLETQGLVATNQNFNTKSDGQSPSEGTTISSFYGDQPMNNKLAIGKISDEQMDYSGIGSSQGNEEGLNAEQWNQEKRSRVESHHQFATSMDRSLMGFIPYQNNTIEAGGLGTVSLTLGLRHGVESSQQRQQHEDQFRRQFGGHMIHDFVG